MRASSKGLELLPPNAKIAVVRQTDSFMAHIPQAFIESTWKRLSQEPPENRRQFRSEFRRQQPVIYAFAETQDAAWFPSGPAKIRELVFFVWLVFLSARRGQVPTVTDGHLAEFLAKAIKTMDTMDEESEYRATEIGLGELAAHPQLELSQFVLGYLVHKEDCPELIPLSTKAAHQHTDVVIRAIDLAIEQAARR